MATRIYWDSCAVIYRVENVTPWARTIERWLGALTSDVGVCVTDLTRMECRLAPLRTGNDELLQRYDDFFARQELVVAELTRSVFDLATQLRARHRLRTPDALHLAAAIEAGCVQFWTNDDRLAAAASRHLAVRALAE